MRRVLGWGGGAPLEMGCFSCFDSPADEQLNPKGGAGYGGSSSPAAAYGGGAGAGRQGGRAYPELHPPMAAPRVEKLSAGAEKARVKSNAIAREPSAPKDANGNAISAQTFTFRELATATRNFRPECFLGEGGFGRVYKGRLESTGQVVAIKQLNRDGLQGNREFLVEVLMLSLLHHQNLVSLIGYCADGDQRLLVYEYMPFGSLEDHLHDLPPDKEALDWNARMKIAAGAAKGLEYLHDKANPPVIYRDFKSSNILLDECFHPKLSDFGLAKLGPVGDKSHVSTRVMGTYGYCAPEYAMTGQLTVKSDVYSFGVVLLELITGRRAIDSTKPHEEQNLVSWARPLFNDRRKLPKMADPRLEGRFPMRGLYQALAVGQTQDQGTSPRNRATVLPSVSMAQQQQQQRRVLRVAPPGGVGGDGEAFPTVQAAVDAVPLGNRTRTVIRLAPGAYREPVYVAKTKNLITLAGASPEATVISWDNTATRIKHAQSSRVIGTGTFGCGTVIVEGEDFIAENITFENSAPQGSGQAVAVRVTADRCAFYNCRFLGWQDTLYLHYGKQYLRDCYIEGNCDFIFGNSIALLEHCHIHCKAAGFITAHSRKSSSESTGYVFLRCIITGNGEAGYMFLGRPWGPFGRVVFAHTFMDRCIKPAGWHNWDKSENERTACFYEFRCSGPGSRPSNRVAWCRQLLDVEAEQFLAHTFIDPDLDRPWLLQMTAIRIPASA